MSSARKRQRTADGAEAGAGGAPGAKRPCGGGGEETLSIAEQVELLESFMPPCPSASRRRYTRRPRGRPAAEPEDHACEPADAPASFAREIWSMLCLGGALASSWRGRGASGRQRADLARALDRALARWVARVAARAAERSAERAVGGAGAVSVTRVDLGSVLSPAQLRRAETVLSYTQAYRQVAGLSSGALSALQGGAGELGLGLNLPGSAAAASAPEAARGEFKYPLAVVHAAREQHARALALALQRGGAVVAPGPVVSPGDGEAEHYAGKKARLNQLTKPTAAKRKKLAEVAAMACGGRRVKIGPWVALALGQLALEWLRRVLRAAEALRERKGERELTVAMVEAIVSESENELWWAVDEPVDDEAERAAREQEDREERTAMPADQADSQDSSGDEVDQVEGLE
eukprot:m51a1_g11808 hypothetical protein (407) ;mRNA; r:354154-355374